MLKGFFKEEEEGEKEIYRHSSCVISILVKNQREKKNKRFLECTIQIVLRAWILNYWFKKNIMYIKFCDWFHKGVGS